MVHSPQEALLSLDKNVRRLQHEIDKNKLLQKDLILEFLNEWQDQLPKKLIYIPYPYNLMIHVIRLPGLRFYSANPSLFLDKEGWDDAKNCDIGRIMGPNETERYILSSEFLPILTGESQTLFL